MRHVSPLIAGVLLLGSFVTPARTSACVPPLRSMREESAAVVAATRRASVPHPSYRSLKRKVRSTWKQNVPTTVKGF